jgi:membrane protein implicated in regulation of membrane protease activity
MAVSMSSSSLPRFLPTRTGHAKCMGTPRMMILIFGALALMVGAIASLALGNWWILVAVLGLHAVISSILVVYVWRQASSSVDKPDPVTEARLEDEEGGDEPQARPGRVAGDREVFS